MGSDYPFLSVERMSQALGTEVVSAWFAPARKELPSGQTELSHPPRHPCPAFFLYF